MKGPAPSGRFVWTGRVFLALSLLVTTVFFATRWALDLRLHARDMSLAILLSFANPLTLYASCALAVVGVVLAASAALARRPWRLFAWAALVSALPVAYLAVFG